MDTRIHFLVVNDSNVMQKVIVALLKEVGYIKISEADDGEMALRSLKAAKTIGSPVDFIITDCAMPLMNGLELIRAVRNQDGIGDMPILMVTAEAKTENIVAAIDAGADSYLVKPFKAASLGKKIEELLASKGLTNTANMPRGPDPR